MFTPELLVLAMTYAQEGRKDFGLELARRYWANLCLVQRHPFDTPNMVDGRTGERLFGTDYYQNMMLWALPGVLAGGDLGSATGPGSLVAKVIAAGQVSSWRGAAAGKSRPICYTAEKGERHEEGDLRGGSPVAVRGARRRPDLVGFRHPRRRAH